jgi:16S rRNA (cytidine1402-2'-O)-methyltransferase
VEPPANAPDTDAANGAATGGRQEQQPPPEPQPATGGKGLDTTEPSGGTLYLVGTPIGNLEDLSPRARRILETADRIACEDTRRSGLLLSRLGIRGRPLISFHSHNEAARIPQLLAALAADQAIALISDAGLPGISDPGEALVAAARCAGRPVVCIPGPTALTTALVSSGLPTGRFCFEGFLPPRGGARRQRLEALAEETRTMVFYEAPHRLVALLEDLLAVLGDRPIQVARELTKRHEQQVGPTVALALEYFRHTAPLGECTVVLGGASAPEPPAWDGEALRSQLEALVASGLSRREAARSLAERSGHSRRALYALLHQPATAAAAEGPEASRSDRSPGTTGPGRPAPDAAE